jgi:cysteine desulfurase
MVKSVREKRKVKRMNKKRIYFDNAATTKPHPRVVEKMLHYLKTEYGNPSSVHSFGRNVRVAVEEARELIADFLNAIPSEIYFTSGGSESNNFAIRGISRVVNEESGKNTILTTTAEHNAVLDIVDDLGKIGFKGTLLNVSENAELELSLVKDNISDRVSLVSVISVNNETGTINKISEICEAVKSSDAIFHTDAVQAFGKTRIDVNQSNIDSLSASGHKIYGPKGIGLLYAKSGTPLSPLIFGGSQERNRRAGTENIAGIVGFAEAVKIADKNLEENFTTVSEIKQKFIEGLNSFSKNEIVINSANVASPYILSITFSDEFFNNDAEAMLIYLDINGIAASNGAACTSGTLNPSHVIMSMGKSESYANGTFRFSFSPDNTIDEVDYTLEILNDMRKKFSK